jgi:ribosomal-protein-alanine N-acetyltransferase
MPAFPDLTPPLSGPAATVRLALEWDIPEVLIAHQDDPELHRRLGLSRPPSGAELGRRVEESDAERRAGRGVWLTVLAPGTENFRGQLDVHDVDWDHGRAELGIWISPGDRGRGLGAGALALVGRWLLADGGLERVEILTEPGNEAMLRSAAAAGFTREGLLRGYRLDRGRRIDIVPMSLIRGDLELT